MALPGSHVRALVGDPTGTGHGRCGKNISLGIISSVYSISMGWSKYVDVCETTCGGMDVVKCMRKRIRAFGHMCACRGCAYARVHGDTCRECVCAYVHGDPCKIVYVCRCTWNHTQGLCVYRGVEIHL